jgi:predicted ATP-dependent endonuclease of OLD family
MKLKQVDIDNFRSIESLSINFNPSCRVLVGKNEVGKSNILMALSMLNSKSVINNNDLREGLPDEDTVNKGVIRFVFTLEPSDKREIIRNQSKRILSLEDNLMLTQGKKEITLENYIEMHFNEGLFKIDIPSGKRYHQYWTISAKYDVLSNWKRPIANTTYTFELNGQNVNLSDYDLINTNDFPEIPIELLESANQNYINERTSKTVLNFVSENKPEALFWYYDDRYLLPSSIDLSSFSSDPDYCMPLKSMFELAGIKDISKSIQEARNRGKQGLRNLLERVATKTTLHFRNVWREYKNIEFELSPNGLEIDASIKDSFNRYELSQRSDGFKRFVSFLLFISAKVESNNMKNTLLLFDEPDLALHPSGQKYLRDELIKISKHNYIVYSTHSIFMIDKEDLNRHLIVEKYDEKTIASEVNESNFIDEEVIFNALGFSVFETLKNNNIIFEGWKDKKIYSVALSRIPEKYKSLKKLKELGLCHAKGVKDVKNIANILELAGREYIVLSDGDKPAKEKQSDFSKMRMNGFWKRYDELVDGFIIATVEDFIKPRCFVKALDTLRKTHNHLPTLKEDSFISSKTKLLLLDDELKPHESDKDTRKEIIEKIKDMVFDELKPSDLEDAYYEMLVKLMEFVLKEHLSTV